MSKMSRSCPTARIKLFGEYCIQSITKAELPPIPPDLAALLEDGKLEIEFSFTIYPN